MSKFCPYCGEELVDDAKFCKNCGKSLENFQNVSGTNNYQYNPPVVENDHTLAFAVGIIFSILIPLIGIIIGIYVYTRRDSSKAKSRGAIVIGLGVAVWILSMIFSLLMF